MKQTKRSAICACGLHEIATPRGRSRADKNGADSVDPTAKESSLKRLRRIEGQVRGLQKMVSEDRVCTDVMTQIAAVHEALRGVGREIMRNHLRHCAATASEADADAAAPIYDELVELMYKSAR